MSDFHLINSVKEWEVIGKKLPDGTIKRYRRRVIPIIPSKKKKTSLDDSPVKITVTPMMNEPYFADQDFEIPAYKEPVVEAPMQVEEAEVEVQSAPIDYEEPPITMYMEEVEIDEKNPEDSWYDPSVSRCIQLVSIF